MVDATHERELRDPEREFRDEARRRPAGFTDVPGTTPGRAATHAGNGDSPRALGDTPPVREPLGSRTTMGLITGLAHDAGQLLRQELELARVEIGEKADHVRKASVEVAAGGAIVHAGLLFLLLAAFLGLDVVVQEPWLSALVVGGVVTLIGLTLLASARRNLKAAGLEPQATVRSLRKDAELVREEAKRVTS